MALFPDVQRKAQEEIDRVFGKPTFPTMADREKLPYIEAVVKEALRWHTVANLGVPHRTDEDDIVEGYLIPRDAMLIPNIWYLKFTLAMNTLWLLMVRTGHSTMIQSSTPSLESSDQSDTLLPMAAILRLTLPT